MTRERRSGPASTRSMASSSCIIPICSSSRRADSSAASFNRLARSAPVKPGVRLASVSRFTPSASGLPFACTSRMWVRPTMSGLSTTIWRSKRPRTQERGVEDVGSVRGGNEDDTGARVEAVHFHEQLVERLLPLVVAAAEAGAAVTADGIDLVDEHDGRRGLLGLVEEIAHAAGTDTDEHLDEVGTRDREEGHARLTGNGPREQRLAGAGRAVEQHALRDLGSHRLEAGRVLEELLDLLQLLDGFVAAGHVGERDLDVRVAVLLGPRLAELQHAAAALHRVHDQEEEPDQQQNRQEREQQREPDRVLLLIDRELDVRAGELGGELVGVLLGERHRVRRAVAQLAGDLVVLILERRVGDAAVRELGLVLVERELLRAVAAAQPRRPDDQGQHGNGEVDHQRTGKALLHNPREATGPLFRKSFRSTPSGERPEDCGTAGRHRGRNRRRSPAGS